MEKVDIAKVFDRLKKNQGYTKDIEIANFLGVSQSVMSNWQRRNSTDFNLIIQKCKHIGVSLDWLFTGRGSMYRDVTGTVSQHGNTAVNGNGEQVSIKGAVQGNTVALAQQENSAEVERLKEALKVCGAEKEALHERLKEAQEVVKNAMEAVKVLATSNRQCERGRNR